MFELVGEAVLTAKRMEVRPLQPIGELHDAHREQEIVLEGSKICTQDRVSAPPNAASTPLARQGAKAIPAGIV